MLNISFFFIKHNDNIFQALSFFFFFFMGKEILWKTQQFHPVVIFSQPLILPKSFCPVSLTRRIIYKLFHKAAFSPASNFHAGACELVLNKLQFSAVVIKLEKITLKTILKLSSVCNRNTLWRCEKKANFLFRFVKKFSMLKIN